MILEPTKENIAAAAMHIKEGGIAAFPTETVYGLGGDILSETAIEKIYSLKGRPSGNPLIVHVPSPKAVFRVADPRLSPAMLERLDRVSRFWPGPLTAVIPKNGLISGRVTAGLPNIAVRVPSHPVALALLEACNTPLAAPSANRSTRLSPTRAEDVAAEFGDNLEIILDGGRCEVGLESTVVSLAGAAPIILRPGAVSAAELSEALGEEVLAASAGISEATAPAPGMLGAHYTPDTPLAFKDTFDFQAPRAKRVGLIAFKSESAVNPAFDYAAAMVLSSSGNMREVATNLFSSLRDMDKLGLDLILIDRCEEHGVGGAIMNRLKRAIGGQ